MKVEGTLSNGIDCFLVFMVIVLLIQNYCLSTHSFYAAKIYLKNQVTVYKSLIIYSNVKYDDGSLMMTTLVY